LASGDLAAAERAGQGGNLGIDFRLRLALQRGHDVGQPLLVIGVDCARCLTGAKPSVSTSICSTEKARATDAVTIVPAVAIKKLRRILA
jgi:hypothetical protein